MWKWLGKRLTARSAWLDPQNPVAQRDARWMPYELPLFLRRLAMPWTLLGYSAMVHGALFVVSILAYNQSTAGLGVAFLPLLSPFLTPFGTPIAAGLLHSILYWAMLIGICNQVTFGIARELESGTWRILRLTPYSAVELMLTKLVTVARGWLPVLQTLLIVRGVALLVIPLAVASQRSREANMITTLDMLSAAFFIAQPYIEAFLAAAVAALAAVMLRSTLWAKVYAYGAVALTLGGLNAISAFWLAFTSPIGPAAGLLVPLGHWSPLVGAVLPPTIPGMYAYQTAVLGLANVILPLIIGVAAMYATLRITREDA